MCQLLLYLLGLLEFGACHPITQSVNSTGSASISKPSCSHWRPLRSLSHCRCHSLHSRGTTGLVHTLCLLVRHGIVHVVVVVYVIATTGVVGNHDISDTALHTFGAAPTCF